MDKSVYKSINGIKVTRVIKIHNFFLKNLFEKKLDNLTENCNSDVSKKKIEFMFYGIDPIFPKELTNIIEKGFKSKLECEKIGMCPYPALFNNVYNADLPRINKFL